MVLVAAVALGSATYAWFVTNDTVKATTTTISAQSNAAFMTIAAGTEGASTSGATSVTTEKGSTKLYPATYGEESGSTKGTWMTGYGKDLDKAQLEGALVACADSDTTSGKIAGSTPAAIAGGFILDQYYNISAKAGQTLSNLTVESVDAVTDPSSNSSLKTALRILVTDDSGDIWEVYGLSTDQTKYEVKLSSNDNNSPVTYAKTIESGTDTAVQVYLYYEGSDENVTTENLVNNQLTATNAVTVTFTATPNNK